MRPDCESERPPSAIPPFPVINTRSIPLAHAGSDAIRISTAIIALHRAARDRARVPVSGQGREIAATVGLDDDAQFRRGDHLDRSTPLIKVPRHLQPAPGAEPDGQTAIGLVLNLLVGVKDEGPGDIGG